MRKLLVHCLLAFVSARLVAAPAGPIDLAAERAAYPDADVITVEELERVAYAPDGTYSSESESWTRLLTEKGRREESTQSLSYSRRYGEAAIAYVGVIGSNGVERAIDVSATTKDMTDNSSMSSNIYDPLDRRITCTIPGLAVGDTLHLRVTRTCRQARVKDQWSDICVMEWTHPILKSVWEVRAPASRPIRAKAVRHALGNVTESAKTLDDGSVLHVFTATNSPQMFPEPDMPPTWTQVEAVRLSTASDWRELSRWYWELCAAHLAKTNAAMAAKVAEVTAGAKTPRARLEAIFRFVSQEIRYMGLTMEDTSPGYAPHDVDITFANRYGVCRDKAGLLAALLRLGGFEAFPVLINVGAKMDEEVPQPFFNHAIVAVDVGEGATGELGKGAHGRYLLMDPTNESTKDIFPSYLCDMSYLVARPEGEGLRTSPVPSPDANALEVVSTGRLDREGAIILENDLAFNGIHDTAFRGALVRQTADDRRKFFDQRLKRLAPGAELIRFEVEPEDMRDTTKPLRVRLVSRLPDAIVRGESVNELTVPFVSRIFGIVRRLFEGSTSLEARKYPLVMPTTARMHETLALDLGGTLGEVAELPDEVRQEKGFAYARSYAVTNGTLFAERSLTLSQVEFSPTEYAELRERLKEEESSSRRRPLFRSDRLVDADTHYLSLATETTLSGPFAWVTTNEVEREILTYRGKKSSAELTFGFNPTWKRIEVVSATVSNRDGRVYSVSPKEINLMDCGWAAAAPRYPAGKTMVVSLPSVEIGSVIRCKTVTTVTNAPAAFYATYGFDSHEPIDWRRVRVDDWVREAVSLRRIPNEQGQPDAALWRDQVTVSRGDWQVAAERLEGACAVRALDPSMAEGAGRELRSIRDWMAKFVRVVGPGLYEVPLELQLTDPAVVLKERYATRLDYVRTLASLLRGAGYEADLVFAADNAKAAAELRRRDREEKPNVSAYAAALCRVRVREGGFLWFGGRTKTYFVGTENEYAPLGVTGYEGCDFFDPATGEFGIVTVPEPELTEFREETAEYHVRPTGEVDINFESLRYGPGVGAFRRQFSEILPEDRSRFYQSLLGAVAQGASATGELETDVEGYPARLKFSCYVSDYAVVGGDSISIRLPSFDCAVPQFVGRKRETPFAVGAIDAMLETAIVHFPPGYTELEHVPSSFTLRSPFAPDEVIVENRVEVVPGGEGEGLTVKIVRESPCREYRAYGAEALGLFRGWNALANSRANHVIIVRRPKNEN